MHIFNVYELPAGLDEHGFGLLYDFVPQSSIFTLLSPFSHFHLL